MQHWTAHAGAKREVSQPPFADLTASWSGSPPLKQSTTSRTCSFQGLGRQSRERRAHGFACRFLLCEEHGRLTARTHPAHLREQPPTTAGIRHTVTCHEKRLTQEAPKKGVKWRALESWTCIRAGDLAPRRRTAIFRCDFPPLNALLRVADAASCRHGVPMEWMSRRPEWRAPCASPSMYTQQPQMGTLSAATARRPCRRAASWAAWEACQ